MKNNKKVRHIILGLMVAALFAMMIVLMMFRGSISQIGKDPTLNLLTGKTAMDVAILVNLNKNNNPDRIEDCWNQKNPLNECTESNRIEPGTYSLRGVDGHWLDETTDFKLPNETEDYYQKIMISYPNENEMLVKIETWNNSGETETQEITLTGPKGP